MIKKILVSQPAPTTEKSPYFDIEKKFKVKIDFRPLIHVERLSTKEFRAEKINILDYRIQFTTRHRPFLFHVQGFASDHTRRHEVLLQLRASGPLCAEIRAVPQTQNFLRQVRYLE